MPLKKEYHYRAESQGGSLQKQRRRDKAADSKTKHAEGLWCDAHDEVADGVRGFLEFEFGGEKGGD